MGRQPARRVSDLDGRVAALEDRYGRPADDDGDRRTVGDILDAHPELTGPMIILWERRHEGPGDLQAAEAALTVWLALRGTRFDDRPSTTTPKETDHATST